MSILKVRDVRVNSQVTKDTNEKNDLIVQFSKTVLSELNEEWLTTKWQSWKCRLVEKNSEPMIKIRDSLRHHIFTKLLSFEAKEVFGMIKSV